MKNLCKMQVSMIMFRNISLIALGLCVPSACHKKTDTTKSSVMVGSQSEDRSTAPSPLYKPNQTRNYSTYLLNFLDPFPMGSWSKSSEELIARLEKTSQNNPQFKLEVTHPKNAKWGYLFTFYKDFKGDHKPIISVQPKDRGKAKWDIFLDNHLDQANALDIIEAVKAMVLGAELLRIPGFSRLVAFIAEKINLSSVELQVDLEAQKTIEEIYKGKLSGSDNGICEVGLLKNTFGEVLNMAISFDPIPFKKSIKFHSIFGIPIGFKHCIDLKFLRDRRYDRQTAGVLYEEREVVDQKSPGEYQYWEADNDFTVKHNWTKIGMISATHPGYCKLQESFSFCKDAVSFKSTLQYVGSLVLYNAMGYETIDARCSEMRLIETNYLYNPMNF